MVFALLLAACSGGGQAERGRAIYDDDCRVCHGDPVTGEGRIASAAVHGPEGHTWHHADGQLVGIVLGQLQYPGRTMPSFEAKLAEDDVLDVLAYLNAGWEPEQREFQAEVSRNWTAQQ